MGERFVILIAGLAIGAVAQAQQSYETRPDIHGDTVVFTAEGDLWLGSISSHSAKRITSDPGTENAAHFSPDGSQIAFTGQYEGGFDVYLMPTSGGAPKRLTYDPKTPVVQGWEPDGSGILFRSARYNTNGVPRLFSVSPNGGMPRLLPIPSAYFGSMNADGLVAYVPISFEWANWFHYAGGEADDIWLANTKTVRFTRLTDYPGVDTTPVWCGGKIYFVSERSGWSNIWQIDPSTKALKQCTFYSSGAVRYPSTDGHRIIFQHGPALALYDPGSDKTTELAFNLDTDRIHAREQRVPLAREIGQPSIYVNTGNLNPNSNGMALGPTGKRILLAPRGQIVSVAAEAGDMRVLEKKPGTRARFPIWSPDGKRFAFLSDRSGENEIWIGDAAGGGTPTQLTHGLASNPFPPMWSPDGKWIAISDRNARVMLIDASSGAIKIVDQGPADQSYDATSSEFNFSPDGKFFAFSRMESNWNYSVNLYEIGTGKRAVVTDSRVNSYDPVFDTTGKFLIYLADSNLNPTSSSILGKLTYQNFTTVQMVALAADTKSPFLPKDDEEGVAAEAKDQAAKKAAETPEATKVDWDGLQSRVIAVPLPPASYGEVESLPGRILALGDGDLVSFGLDSRKATPIVSGIQAFEKSRDNKKLLFYAGGTISVHDADTGPTTPTAGAVDLSPYSITYEPIPEWHQIFEES